MSDTELARAVGGPVHGRKFGLGGNLLQVPIAIKPQIGPNPKFRFWWFGPYPILENVSIKYAFYRRRAAILAKGQLVPYWSWEYTE